MKRNIGSSERIVRAVLGIAMIWCAVLAPLPVVLRVPALGGLGAYLLVTAVAGTCLGYKLMGKSTCTHRSVERA